jgi:hypothetical protein
MQHLNGTMLHVQDEMLRHNAATLHSTGTMQRCTVPTGDSPAREALRVIRCSKCLEHCSRVCRGETSDSSFAASIQGNESFEEKPAFPHGPLQQ